MIVVHMFRIGAPADRADPALLRKKLLELLLPHAVAPAQVGLAAAATESLTAVSLPLVAPIRTTAKPCAHRGEVRPRPNCPYAFY
ncbi:hypothetical protein GA0070620_1573 [Micromonospora krabiensis]|uniref:Uncharacterized protein n=1 Tax=Micromonospora krabiensis TaxID=307121 RepID=A0A1C3N0L0_9ACTN|nr:hypothetical protein GA0070620_1573 [Micromonospora krabiensis]